MKEKCINRCCELMMCPETKNWSSSQIAWRSLYESCENNQDLQELVKKDAKLLLRGSRE